LIEGGKLNRAIQRLRVLATEEGGEAAAAGRQAGRDWACVTATPKQLRKLAGLCDEELENILDESAHSAYGPAERLAFALLPEDVRDRDEARRFWKLAMETNPKDLEVDFLSGFVDGAREAWGEIEPRL